jgi:hypothetical protein
MMKMKKKQVDKKIVMIPVMKKDIHPEINSLFL